MLNDADADYDCLYPKKLVHEPTGYLASIIKSVTFNKSKSILTRSLDYVSLSKISGMSPTVLKNDLDALSHHLLQLIVGNSTDSNQFRRKTMKINLGIGHLVVQGFGSTSAKIQFQATPLHLIVKEANEQQDFEM